MRVYFATLGCKLNESEIEAWTRKFEERGDEIVDDPVHADLCVVNTCAVTQAAARKSRSLVKKVAVRAGPPQIIVTGCYATTSPEQVKLLPSVALIVPNRDKDNLVSLAGDYWGQFEYDSSENGCRLPEASSGELSSQVAPHLRTRAFVKVEDGCNMGCTYCIIPLARGRARSRPEDDIVDEVRQLVSNGYQEVILTGVQISDYRLEERRNGSGRLRGLCALVRAILEETNLKRLRLTSIAPWDLERELLYLFESPRLCRHLHLSLQSGSDAILKRMRRPYTTIQFEQAVTMARQLVPDVAITTDVIVGFPGESETEFSDSLRFVERIQFARVHVFPYSARAGTAAARLPDHVEDHVKRARVESMLRVAEQSSSRFVEHFIGRTMPVLFEREGGAAGTWSGHTDNYIKVVTHSAAVLANRIVPARLAHAVDGGAWATL